MLLEEPRCLAAPAAQARPLRFGILCNTVSFAAWQAHCIEHLVQGGLAIPALVILNGAPPAPRNSLPRRLLAATRDGNLFWRIYRRAVMKGLPAARMRDMSGAFAGVPSITCRAELRGKFSEYFLQEDVDRIGACQLDFVIRFGFGILRGPILDVARYGVWSYHHGDVEKYRGMPPGFWEVFNGDPVCGVTLQRLTDRLDAGIVLRKGHFKTILKSYRRSLDNAMAASVDFPAQVVRDIARGADPYIRAPASATTAPIFRAPRNPEMIRFLLRQATHRAKDTYGWLFRHAQWNVGVVDQPIHAFLAADFRPEISWLAEPPKDRFLADPFAVTRDAGLTLLVEEFDFTAAKGHVSAVDWCSGGKAAPIVRVMDAPVHLSYPYTFEFDGRIYCVPEMSKARRIDLLRAVVFPTQWETAATLLDDVDAVDTTVIRHDGRWWMFFARSCLNHWVRLYAFYAEDLTGPWHPHAANPLKNDVRSSRPAGTPFLHEGVLYRPAQDGSRSYGGAVAINRVVSLTPTEFSEEVCRVFELEKTQPYAVGCHTLSAAGSRTVIDGKRAIFQFAEFRREVASIVRRSVPRMSTRESRLTSKNV